jgi:alkyl sulfatase BDS1-like metallo-beta-lactamase superfamily hydrolase
MGGEHAVVEAASASNQENTIEGWQWSLYLTSQLLQVDSANQQAKDLRAAAARALGQRTASANARGFYISEALLYEEKMTLGEQKIDRYQQILSTLSTVTMKKLKASPLQDNVQFIRYLVDSRKAEGKRAVFNLHFEEEKAKFGVALRNGVIAVNDRLNDGVDLHLTKKQWSQLILGELTFKGLDESLEAVDASIVR